jgi:hypothetical protein
MQGNVKMPSPRDARIAGALYLAALPLGCVRGAYVQSTVLAGNAAATADAAP